jgi:DNA-binding transcriptional LysR family regulator
MELRQLRYMLMLAEEKNFSRAAEKLYIAQPYLSLAIQKLEQQIGTKLFHRKTTPLKLTSAGEQFAQMARQMLQLDSNLMQQMKDFSEETRGSLALGISTARSAYILPIVLPTFRALFPQVNLRLHEGTSANLEEWMNEGLTDLTVLSLPIKSDVFSCEILMQEKFLIVAPPAHPLAQNLSDTNPPIALKLAELEHEPFILLQQGQTLRRIADSLFLQAGYAPRIVLETRSSQTAHNLASIGVGFTFSTQSISQVNHTATHPVRLFTADPSYTRTIAVAYRKGKYLTKYEQAFIYILKEMLPSDTSAG